MTQDASVHQVPSTTVESLAAELVSVRQESERRLEALSKEIVRLQAGTARVAAEDECGELGTSSSSSERGDKPVSRRGALLAMGGVAAGGLGMAVGSALMNAQPAAAANGSALILGEGNSASAATSTGVTAGALGMSIECATGSGYWGIAGGSSGLATFEGFQAGVVGDSLDWAGVAGFSSESYGVYAEGGLAPLRLGTNSVVGAPESGSHLLGELYVDADGVYYKCVSAGTPGVWAPLNVVVPLPNPVRVIDTTTSTGGISGPLVASNTPHTTSNLTGGTNGIPAGAIGVVGNLAISGVGGALLNGFGTATLFAGGASTPATVNINAGASCFAISNSVTVKFGTGGNAGKLSLVWNGGGPVLNAEAFLDVAGYII